MVEVDGLEYELDNAETNAQRVMDSINDYATENNITDDDGEVVQMTKNWANPLYMLMYGVGALFTYVQNLLVSAANSISLTSSSDRQLLNLADIAMMRRKTATKTTVIGTVYANLASDTAVDCRITTDLTCTTVSGSTTVTFSPAYDVTVPIGGMATIVMIADVEGSFSIPANTLSFDTEPTGFRALVTNASIPGQVEETIAKLRQRMQTRSVSYTAQDAAAEEIGQLEGVTVASVYYNNSVVDSETVNGIVVPPRQALVFVQGYSPDIAKAFYTHMDCQVAGENAPNVITQYYVTHARQQIPVYIQQPEQINAYIRLYIPNSISDVQMQQYKDTIATLAQDLTIGATLTSDAVLALMRETYPKDSFQGCQVSNDGEAYMYRAKSGPYQLFTFNSDNIQVIADD